MSNLHLALIMDGNGRWAKQRGYPRAWGHIKGARVLKDLVEACPDLGIRYLTVYAFSSENWKRPEEEIRVIMNLFSKYLHSQIPQLHKNGVCLKFIGDRKGLDSSLLALMQKGEDLTQHNKVLGLQIAINYGGRSDLLQAFKKLAVQVQEGLLCPDAIKEEDVQKALWTFPWPDPDLCLRTGGEMRLSNYLLWEMHYTELIFLEKRWPDFTREDLTEAVRCFFQRSRRFGSVSQMPVPSCEEGGGVADLYQVAL